MNMNSAAPFGLPDWTHRPDVSPCALCAQPVDNEDLLPGELGDWLCPKCFVAHGLKAPALCPTCEGSGEYLRECVCHMHQNCPNARYMRCWRCGGKGELSPKGVH